MQHGNGASDARTWAGLGWAGQGVGALPTVSPFPPLAPSLSAATTAHTSHTSIAGRGRARPKKSAPPAICSCSVACSRGERGVLAIETKAQKGSPPGEKRKGATDRLRRCAGPAPQRNAPSPHLPGRTYPQADVWGQPEEPAHRVLALVTLVEACADTPTQLGAGRWGQQTSRTRCQ